MDTQPCIVSHGPLQVVAPNGGDEPEEKDNAVDSKPYAWQSPSLEGFGVDNVLAATKDNMAQFKPLKGVRAVPTRYRLTPYVSYVRQRRATCFRPAEA